MQVKLLGCLVCLAVVAGGFSVQPAHGQRYKTKEFSEGFRLPDPDVDLAAYRRAKSSRDRAVLSLERDVKSVLDGSFDLGQNRTKLDQYFNGYLLPQMTQYESEKVDFGSMRQRLIRDILARATGRAARIYLLDNILFPFAKEIVQEDYHPAARVNAMALIADLDREPAQGTSAEPVPMSECLQYMLNALQSDQAPEYLKIPAMQGIERHAAYDSRVQTPQIGDTQRTTLEAELLKILNSQYTGEQDTDDLIYYKQRIAARTLGYLGSTGTNGVVLGKLQSIIADQSLRPWLRLDAVEAFGRLTLDAADPAQLTQTTTASVNYLIESLRGEAKYIADEVAKMRENALVFTGKDLAKTGSAKDEEQTLRKASAGLGGDFEKAEDDTNAAPKIDLPNYRLNLIRRKMKLVGDVVGTALAGDRPAVDQGLIVHFPEDKQLEMLKLANEIRKMLRDLDVAVMGESFDQGREYTEHEEFLEPITERLRRQMEESADVIEATAKNALK